MTGSVHRIFFVLTVLLTVPQTRHCCAWPITRLPTNERIVALTFDACPARHPQHFDQAVLDYIVAQQLPVTLFISGIFARETADDIRCLVQYSFVEIEHHSVSHNNHMEHLSDARVLEELDEAFLKNLTGASSQFFRFPAGNYDNRTLGLAEQRFRVVQWSFPSGDAEPGMTPAELSQRVLARVQPGSILIFHINGNGHGTAGALPHIVEELKKQGYRFVKLAEALGRSSPEQ